MSDQGGQGGEDRCRFFDREGVIREESAESIEEHLASCRLCQQDQRKVAAVREELRRIPLPPDAGHWEQAVFSRIASRQSAQRRRRLFLVVPFMAAAVFAIFLWRRPSSGPGEAQPLLAVRYEPGAVKMRALDQPTKGATMVVTASGLGSRFHEIRIYRDGPGLAFQCAGEPACARQANGLVARWTIPAEGTYRLVLISSAAAIPPATAGYEVDMVAVRGTGASVVEELVEVY